MNIAHRRKTLGMTQGELALKLNVDRSAVAKWESGDALPRSDKLPEIAQIFGCTIDDLFANEETVGSSESD